MKTLLCAFGASGLLCTGNVSAQNMLDGSFTGNFPPKDWHLENALGSKSWGVAWGGGADGGNYANLYEQNAGAVNDAWIVTPQLRPSAESHDLVFCTKKSSADTSGMTLSVYVSATGNSMADFTGLALLSLLNTREQQDFSLAWTADTLDLSAYQGQDIFVAFRMQDNAVQVSLDEISGLPLSVFETDFRVNTLSLVPDNILFAGGDAVRLQALVENRVNEEASVTVSFSVDGQVVGTDVVEFDSAYVDTAFVEYAFGEAAIYTLQASVPEDENNINNELEMEVEVYPENFLMEDFNANKPFPPQEWQAIVEKGGGSISHSAYSNDGPTVSKGYVTFSNDYNATLETGSARWLISPQIKPDAAHHELSFYVRMGNTYSSNPASSLSVLVSTASSNLEDFETELATYVRNSERADLPENAWVQESVDLSAYEGQDVFVAFRVEDYNTCTWNVDEAGGLFLSSFAEDARVRMLSLAEPNRYWFAGEEIEVMALVDNYGTEAMQDIAVEFSVNGDSEATQAISLDSKEMSDTLTFRFTPGEAGFYQFALSVPDDDNNINNAASLADPVRVYPEGFFIEGFEGLSYDEMPKYWSCDMTTRGSEGWSVNTASAFRGRNSISSQTGYRLMTPLLQVGETDSLCFYTRTTWPTAVYAVLGSTDAMAWDTLMVDTIQGGNNAPWELQTIYFDAQEDGFYGNRYFALVNLQNNMFVDEVFGPMLASRNDQFSMVSLAADPETVNVAGQESRFRAVVYNDGTQSQSKEVSWYLGEELLTTAQVEDLAPGNYDTLSLAYVFDEAFSNGSFRVVLPEDASVYDNEASLTAHVYEPGLWRMEDGFEDASHPYWIFEDENMWSGKPSYGAVEPASGQDYLNCDFGGANPTLAVSPYMELPYDEYQVSLDVYRNAAVADRPDKIELGFGAKPAWEDVVFVDSLNRLASAYPVGTQGWATYTFTVDLADLQAGFFLIRAVGRVNQYNTPSYENLPIDNLRIRPVLAKDAEITGLTAPVDTVWGAESVKTALRVNLLNYGSETLTSASLHYGYGDTESGVYEWSGSLASGADTTVLLTSDWTLPNMDSLAIYVEVETEGDEAEMNNRMEKVLRVKQAYALPFVANFEDSAWSKDWQNFSFTPQGLLWRQLDTTGDDNWIEPPFGGSCAWSASVDDYEGEVVPDNWLVTPGLAIEHPQAWLSFYVQAVVAEEMPEPFQVLVSTRSDRDTAFFSPVLDTAVFDSLRHFVLPLDGYKGEVLHIAFRHFGAGEYRLLLDSVHVYYPELFDLTATVNPAEAGTVEGAGRYILGEEVVLTATGNEGWRFTGWYKDAALASEENPYRFECEGDAAYEARFEEVSYTITLTAGEGGSVSPSGEQTVRHGADLSVTITPDEGYVIEYVLVDGASVGAVATYAFEEVTADHSLEASFRPDVANETEAMAGVHVYPNPYAEDLHVESALPMNRIVILNLQGQEEAAYDLDGRYEATLRPALADGFYLMLVEYVGGETAVLRVVKANG